MRTGRAGELVVLESFPRPQATTNPYIVQLLHRVEDEPDVHILTFSWRNALLGRYDVFHWHWPEALFDGRSALTRTAHDLFFALLLLRLRLRRVAVVRTMHNLETPTGLRPLENFLLRRVDRGTDLWIRLNALTPVPGGRPSQTIRHGHYRDWFAEYPAGVAVPGRLVFFGLVRHYKGVDNLVNAFLEVHDPVLTSLTIAGKPSSPVLAEELRSSAAGDSRIVLDLRFLDEREIAEVVGSAELVVLPYREMHNSGGTLTALSLGRPVLVPENAVNRELAGEVGPGWVHTYTGGITPERLVATVVEMRRQGPSAPPDLSAREWVSAGAEHVRAFRRAVELRGGRGRRR